MQQNCFVSKDEGLIMEYKCVTVILIHNHAGQDEIKEGILKWKIVFISVLFLTL